MQGLELCKQYFEECGLPRFEKECPELLPRMAIGLVGDGSECFGFDDHISRDHDWGPGFCIWLQEDDLQTCGQRVQQIYDTLPRSFKGFGARLISQYGGGRIGVLGIHEFYRRYIGTNGIPQALRQWLAIPENGLATAVNGEVFHDPSGHFTAIRKTLIEYYPEDVRLKKIAARCMTAGQAGQYNYPRCIQRNEIYAAGQSEMKFLEAALSLIFLLNKKYLPFYKWAHRAVKELPILGTYVYEAINKLMATEIHIEKQEIIEEISLEIIMQLNRLGMSSSRSSDFLPDHGPLVQGGIEDAEMRGYSVLVG